MKLRPNEWPNARGRLEHRVKELEELRKADLAAILRVEDERDRLDEENTRLGQLLNATIDDENEARHERDRLRAEVERTKGYDEVLEYVSDYPRVAEIEEAARALIKVIEFYPDPMHVQHTPEFKALRLVIEGGESSV